MRNLLFHQEISIRKIFLLFLFIGIITTVVIHMLILKPWSSNLYIARDDAFAEMQVASIVANELKSYGKILLWDFFTNDIFTPSSCQILLGLFDYLLRSPKIVLEIYSILLSILSYLGAYLLVNDIIKRPEISFVTSFIYAFSIKYIDDLLRGHFSLVTGYCFAPLMFFFMRRFLLQDKLKLNNLVHATVLLSIILTSHVYNTIIYSLLVLTYVLYISIISVTVNKKERIRKFGMGLLLISSSILLSVWFFGPGLFSGKFFLAYLGQLAPASIQFSLKYSSDFFHALIFMPMYVHELIKREVLLLFVFSNILVFLIINYLLINLKKSPKCLSHDLMYTIILLVCSITLSLGQRTPLGIAFSNFFPGIRVYERFLYLTAFSVTVMFSIALKVLSEPTDESKNFLKLKHLGKKKMVRLFMLLCLFIPLINPILTSTSSFKAYVQINNKIIKGFEKVKEREIETKDEPLPYAIFYPSQWQGGVYSVYKDIPVQNLPIAFGPLVDYPLPFLSGRSAYLHENCFYGPHSYLNNILTGDYFSSELAKVLSLLGVKYLIVMPKLLPQKVVLHINELTNKTKGLEIIYDSEELIVLRNNYYTGRIKTIDNVITAIGGLHGIPSFLSILSNQMLLRAFLFHPYLLNKQDDILDSLRISNTIVLEDGASVYDLIYLLHGEELLHPISSSTEGHIIEESLKDKGWFVLNEKTYRVSAGSSIILRYFVKNPGEYKIFVRAYLSPTNITLMAYLDGEAMREVTLTCYPAFGYKWFELGKISLKPGEHALTLRFVGDEEREWTSLDAIMVLEETQLENLCSEILQILSGKEIIYVVSPGYALIRGSNVHVESDSGCADGWMVRMGWKGSGMSKLWFDVPIEVYKNENYTMVLRVSSNSSLTLKFNINSQEFHLTIPNTQGNYECFTKEIGTSLTNGTNKIVIDVQGEILIDEIMFVPSNSALLKQSNAEKPMISVKTKSKILDSTYFEIFVKEGGHPYMLVVNVPFNTDWSLEDDSLTFSPLSALGFLAFYSKDGFKDGRTYKLKFKPQEISDAFYIGSLALFTVFVLALFLCKFVDIQKRHIKDEF